MDRAEGRLLHGEAIAIGMICESYLATKKCDFPKAQLEEIADYVKKIFGLIQIDKSTFEDIVQLTSQDKKNEGVIINSTLIKEIGEGVINIPISTGDVIDSLFYYNSLSDK